MAMKFTKEVESHPKIFMQAEYFFIISILVGLLIGHFWPLVFPKVIRISLGIVLNLAAICIMVPSVELFQKAKTPISPKRPAKTLITKGPYKNIRHPMYISRVLIQAGIGFFFGNIWIIILSVPTFILVWYKVIIPEERYLEQKFGQKYLQYKASTWF